MKLDNEELTKITAWMDTYPIMYLEVYNEILDHAISAAETARENGDTRDIEVLFQEIMDTQFGNFKEIRKLVLYNVMAYNKKINKVFWNNIKGYLNWQTVTLMVVVIIVSFYLPKTKTIEAILSFGVIIASFFPSFYSLYKTWGIKTGKKKQSLSKTYVLGTSRFLTIFTYVMLFVPRIIPKSWHLDFLNPLTYSPFIYVTLICFFIIYTLSTMQLYKLIFKTGEFSNLSVN